MIMIRVYNVSWNVIIRSYSLSQVTKICDLVKSKIKSQKFKSNPNQIKYLQMKSFLLKSNRHMWFNHDLNQIMIWVCLSLQSVSSRTRRPDPQGFFRCFGLLLQFWCARFSFFNTVLSEWLRRTVRKWHILVLSVTLNLNSIKRVIMHCILQTNAAMNSCCIRPSEHATCQNLGVYLQWWLISQT